MTAPGAWYADRSAFAGSRSAKLRLERRGRAVDAFVVECDGCFYAYVNRCPHVGTPLDLWPNEFFGEGGTTLVCATHGAVFEPATGRCIAGPCVGDALTPLDVIVDRDRIAVGCPER